MSAMGRKLPYVIGRSRPMAAPQPSEISEVLVRYSSNKYCIYVQYLFLLERKPCLKVVAAAEQ